MKLRSQNPKRKQVDKNYIGVTAKIFSLLEYFIKEGAKQQPFSFQKISSVLLFERTTVNRFFFSFKKLGYVEKADAKPHSFLVSNFFNFPDPAVHFRRLQSL